MGCELTCSVQQYCRHETPILKSKFLHRPEYFEKSVGNDRLFSNKAWFYDHTSPVRIKLQLEQHQTDIHSQLISILNLVSPVHQFIVDTLRSSEVLVAEELRLSVLVTFPLPTGTHFSLITVGHEIGGRCIDQHSYSDRSSSLALNDVNTRCSIRATQTMASTRETEEQLKTRAYDEA